MADSDLGRPLRIVMVAGEASGDQLGAGLITALQQYGPVEVAGVGGVGMQSAGLVSWADQERMAVMGLFEVIRHLPDLLRLRRDLLNRTLAWQPDLFLGIDSPDFNLPLARRLRERGLSTAHYVSPSVWAWRQGRIRGIRASVDLMLTLFPFESDFYRAHGVPEVCVGHPMASRLPHEPDVAAYQRALSLTAEQCMGPVLALLPGSRAAEIRHLGPDFIAAARRLKARLPALTVLVPAASDARRQELEAMLDPEDEGWIRLVAGQSHTVMGASTAVLVASGTATLEAALLKKPMVVGYRFNALTYWLGKKLVRTPWVALPNILARETVVPELLQQAVTPEALEQALLPLLTPDSSERQRMVSDFRQLHHMLDRDADRSAATAIRSLVNDHG